MVHEKEGFCKRSPGLHWSAATTPQTLKTRPLLEAFKSFLGNSAHPPLDTHTLLCYNNSVIGERTRLSSHFHSPIRKRGCFTAQHTTMCSPGVNRPRPFVFRQSPTPPDRVPPTPHTCL
jgi:hypothetical protein